MGTENLQLAPLPEGWKYKKEEAPDAKYWWVIYYHHLGKTAVFCLDEAEDGWRIESGVVGLCRYNRPFEPGHRGYASLKEASEVVRILILTRGDEFGKAVMSSF